MKFFLLAVALQLALVPPVAAMPTVAVPTRAELPSVNLSAEPETILLVVLVEPVGGAGAHSGLLDAFGILIHKTGSTPNNYLYAGEQNDPALGLYYNRARYLNVGTGRFHTMDTVGGVGTDPTSLHRYLYVHANPVNNIDPSGLKVYVVYRPFNAPVLVATWRLIGHYYLAFDYEAPDGSFLASEWAALVEQVGGSKEPKAQTFSFHPRKLDPDGDSNPHLLTASESGSYIGQNHPVDIDAFTGAGEGDHYEVPVTTTQQFQLYQIAIASRNKNNGIGVPRTPDPGPYKLTTLNCGSWARTMLQRAQLQFPNEALRGNLGIGIGGWGDYLIFRPVITGIGRVLENTTIRQSGTSPSQVEIAIQVFTW